METLIKPYYGSTKMAMGHFPLTLKELFRRTPRSCLVLTTHPTNDSCSRGALVGGCWWLMGTGVGTCPHSSYWGWFSDISSDVQKLKDSMLPDIDQAAPFG